MIAINKKLQSSVKVKNIYLFWYCSIAAPHRGVGATRAVAHWHGIIDALTPLQSPERLALVWRCIYLRDGCKMRSLNFPFGKMDQLDDRRPFLFFMSLTFPGCLPEFILNKNSRTLLLLKKFRNRTNFTSTT